MKVDRTVLLGWTWFGIGRVRFYVSDSSWYTIWMLFLTRKFAIGFHVGGGNRKSDCGVEYPAATDPQAGAALERIDDDLSRADKRIRVCSIVLYGLAVFWMWKLGQALVLW